MPTDNNQHKGPPTGRQEAMSEDMARHLAQAQKAALEAQEAAKAASESAAASGKAALVAEAAAGKAEESAHLANEAAEEASEFRQDDDKPSPKKRPDATVNRLAAELEGLDEALREEGVTLAQVIAAAAGSAFGVLKDDTRHAATPLAPTVKTGAQNAV